MNTAAAAARAAGTQKHQRQPRPSAKSAEQSPSASTAPTLCEAFHTDILVASSFGCIQWASIFAHGGKPMPCVQPFSIQKTAKKSVRLEHPKKKLVAAESARPTAMKIRPLSLSAQKPFMKRLSP